MDLNPADSPNVNKPETTLSREKLFQTLGFKWETLDLPLSPPNMDRALFRMFKLLPEMVFDIVHLEGNPYTYPEVQTVLEGITVGGKKVSDTQQVINQRDSLKLMVDLVRSGKFSLTKEVFCAFNATAAKDEALEAGEFRSSGVGIAGTNWKPPQAGSLDALFANGMEALSELDHPMEKAIAIFLFGARTQFFFDGNKRSSRLMMNSLLLEAGQDVITVPAKLRNDFNTKMVRFYDSGDASEMMKFMGGLQIKSRFE